MPATTKTLVWNGSAINKCDLCKRPIANEFVDGATRMGPWGILCPTCHRTHGQGIGIGKGQRYIRNHNTGQFVKVDEAKAPDTRPPKESRKLKLIDDLIHAQRTYTDESGLVKQLRASLERLTPVTLSQLATVIGVRTPQADIRTIGPLMREIEQRITELLDSRQYDADTYHHAICEHVCNEFQCWQTDEEDDKLPMWVMHVVAGMYRDWSADNDPA
jgi:hypothetical protein